MKKFIAGLLVVLSVFAFMSCTTTTYTEKTVTLKSTDGAVASSTVTISADSNADAYVFVGGAYVSVTKNPYTGTYGTLTAVKKNSDWTVNYVGGTTAGKETINVYIGTTTGAVMDKSFGTIIANCEATVKPAPGPEPKTATDLSIMAGYNNSDIATITTADTSASGNTVGIFCEGYWRGDYRPSGSSMEIYDKYNVDCASLNIRKTSSTSAAATLTGINEHYGETSESFTFTLATYTIVEGVKVAKEVLDTFDINVTVTKAVIYELDNVISTNRKLFNNAGDSHATQAFYISNGKYVRVPETFNQTSPAIGSIGYITYEYTGDTGDVETEWDGVVSFVPSVTSVEGEGSLDIYFSDDDAKTITGTATIMAHTLVQKTVAMTAVDDISASYTYAGALKGLERPTIMMYTREAQKGGYSEITAEWVDEGSSFNSVLFNNAWYEGTGVLDENTIGLAEASQGITDEVVVTVNAERAGSGSVEIIFGYDDQTDAHNFIAFDWIKLTHTF